MIWKCDLAFTNKKPSVLHSYCCRAGYYQTALKLAKHSDIQDFTNIDLFVAAKEVEESLAKHETLKCLTWYEWDDVHFFLGYKL